MKKISKILSLLLAAIMVLTMNFTITAFASGYKITINETTDNHTYKIYQIFTGTMSGTELTNIAFGDGVDTSSMTSGTTAAAVASALATSSGLGTTTSANISSNYDCEEIVAWLESKYGITLATTASDTISSADAGSSYTYTSSELEAGYYVIIDSVSPATGSTDTTVSSYLVRLLSANLEINPKKSVPELTKEIKDYNDSTGTDEGWGESADYDIGDQVEFKITATLPSNYADYNVYYMLFTDTMSRGLTYTDGSLSVEVYKGDSLVTTLDPDDPAKEYSVETETDQDGVTTLKISIADLTSVTGASSIDSTCKVVVTYTAELNENAVIGDPGNPNTVKLTYTNNPNTTGDGTSETTDTPEEKVVAFTYELDVTKTDDNSNALNGAGFTLYKEVKYDTTSGVPSLTSYSSTAHP